MDVENCAVFVCDRFCSQANNPPHRCPLRSATYHGLSVESQCGKQDALGGSEREDTYMKCSYTLVFMAGIAWPTTSGQQNVHEQLERMSILEQHEQPDTIIETVPRLIDSNALDRGEAGRAWLLLGSAFQEKEDSLSAYEKALKIYSQAPIDQRGYATAMDDLADLYQETGEVKIAISVEHKSLATFEKMSDHAGIT